MQRYFVKSCDKDTIIFSPEQYHHIARVMRMKVGDMFYVVLQTQETGKVQIDVIEDEQIAVSWIETVAHVTEMPVKVTIACGLPKGDKLEWIVQKATELGVHAIQPLETKWSVVKWDAKKKDKKQERLQKIAQEAAEQSHRQVVPFVHEVQTLSRVLQDKSVYTHIMVAYEESAKQSEKSSFKSLVSSLSPGDHVLAVFGAEGGLDPSEVALLIENGARSCGLGPRIMRAETAPLYVLSAISYYLELGE